MGNKKGNQLYIADSLGSMWHFQRDLKPCRRCEGPSRTQYVPLANHLIANLDEQQMVHKGILKNLKEKAVKQ